jgi:hypothetical protein
MGIASRGDAKNMIEFVHIHFDALKNEAKLFEVPEYEGIARK